MKNKMSCIQSSLSSDGVSAGKAIYSSFFIFHSSFNRAVYFSFFIFHFSLLSAQVGDVRHDLCFGLSGGADMSFIDFSPRIKQTLQPGACGGIVVRYTSEKYFSMLCAAQLEVNYTQRGWNELIDDGSANTYSRTTTYVEVPFLAHLSFGREHRGAQFFLNAGPAVGWYLGATEHYGYTADHPWDVSSRPNHVTAQYGRAVERPFEYGITGGLGVELLTAIGHFTLEGRYFFGLSDIYGNSKADPFGRSANNTISARLAYLIDL